MSIELINPRNKQPLKRIGADFFDVSGNKFSLIRGVLRISHEDNYTDIGQAADQIVVTLCLAQESRYKTETLNGENTQHCPGHDGQRIQHQAAPASGHCNH